MVYTFYYNKNIAQALYLSLLEDAFYIELEKNIAADPAVRREGMLRYYDYSMREAELYGELVLPENGEFGASVWSKPTPAARSEKISLEKRQFLATHLGAQSLRSYTEIVDFMAEMSKDVVPADSWYLSIVGLAPHLQGQGLGGALIKPVLEKVDALGLPSYLETFTAKNMRFYQRLGYREAAFFDEPVTDSRYWIMLREAE